MPREKCQKYFERENIAFTCMQCNWIGISWIMQWAFFSSIKTIWIWGSWNWRVIAIDWEFSWLGFCCPICCSRHAHISQILYIDFEPAALWFMVMQQERERQGKRGRGSQPITGCQNSSVALLPPHLDWLCFLSLCCGSSYILRLIKNTICQCVGQVCACLCVCQHLCARVTCIYANTYVRICWNTARHAHNMTARS